MKGNTLYSIVVPVFNSKLTLTTLVNRICSAMNKFKFSFEIILVDDGSTDGSFEEIKRLSKNNRYIKGLKLSRNFGQQIAIIMGLKKSRGDFVAIIDDDLQDPPELLPEFFNLLHEEADVVYGIRGERRENFIRKYLYLAFYKILRKLSKVDIPINAGDFCVMKRQVVDTMLNFQEANPFLRGIRAWVGFKQRGKEYKRAAREEGRSGYTLRAYFNLAISGIISFSYIPLRISLYLGIISAIIGFSFALYVVFLWFYQPFNVPGYASLIVIITFLGGIQLIALGIIGEYLSRLNDNARHWPIAVIEDTTT